VGTMAEIKRMSSGDDGAVTAITKGRQRFWVSDSGSLGSQHCEYSTRAPLGGTEAGLRA